jgi:hypothetical protein
MAVQKAREGVILLGTGVDMSGFIEDVRDAKQAVDDIVNRPSSAGPNINGDNRNQVPDTGGGDVETNAQKLAAEEAERYKANLVGKVDALTQSLLTEEERMFESFDRRQLMVQDALAMDVITHQQHNDLLLSLEEQFEDQKTKIAEKAAKDRMMLNSALVGNTASMLGSISQLMTTAGKKQSKEAKYLAQASIIANTAAGIMKSHAQVPWPGNWAEAGAIALAGAASLRQLNMGGSIQSAGGGITAPGDIAAPPPVETPTGAADLRGETVIQLTGNFYGWDDQVIDELVDGIASAVEDRDVRIISPTSRNGQDLAAVTG